jgi:hypothetical protein
MHKKFQIKNVILNSNYALACIYVVDFAATLSFLENITMTMRGVTGPLAQT